MVKEQNFSAKRVENKQTPRVYPKQRKASVGLHMCSLSRTASAVSNCDLPATVSVTIGPPGPAQRELFAAALALCDGLTTPGPRAAVSLSGGGRAPPRVTERPGITPAEEEGMGRGVERDTGRRWLMEDCESGAGRQRDEG